MLAFARQAIAKQNEAASRFAGSCLNSQRITATLREAQPHLAIGPELLDTDPMLLNFQNGTVELQTGLFRGHCRRDLITKILLHDYRPGMHNAPCS